MCASVLFVAALVGCQPELPPLTWKGKVVHFGAHDPDAVCAGTLEWMDARASGLREVFGDRTFETIDYFWIPEGWSEQRWCEPWSEGCSEPGVVYAKSVPIEHELVHAIRRDRLPVVFEEGLAQLFGDIGWVGTPSSRDRLLESLESSELANFPDYDRASHFVAFLVESYGLAPLGRLAELGNYRDDYPKVRSDFQAAFGFSIDQALAEYEDYPDCDPLAWVDTRIACTNPGILVQPTLEADAELSLNLGCDQPSTLGPHAGFMYAEMVLEVEVFQAPVWIELIGDLGSDVSAALVQCGVCADSVVVWVSQEFPLEQSELPAGRYVLRLFRPVDDPGELGLKVGY